MHLRLLLLAVCLAVPATARADISLRVSVKFILSSSGQRPVSCCGFGASSIALTNSQAVIDNIAYSNELLRRSGRGYTLQLTEIVDVSGWSGFYNLAARSSDNRSALEAVATSNATTRAQFAWRDNAINIYINNTSSGVCSFPETGDDAIFVGSSAYDTLLIHELGHYFGLYHTHQGEQYLNTDNSGCSSANCSCARLIGGTGDEIADTVADHQCWSYSQMVANNPSASTTAILNTFTNIMSYHIPADRFTTLQLDRWTDYAGTSRSGVATGVTRFVDGDDASFIQIGLSTLPFDNVPAAVNVSAPSDIVLIRAGNYGGSMTLNRATTLRATRGAAVLGKP
ncbi:MAG: hypothetical protein RJA22_2807 [Verrucomicrobiota bacterium]|jgi:hypothetical protein